MKREPAFKTETDLCAAFISALPNGWTAYPETHGWDILLAHSKGFQIGIEAKLRLNIEVIRQCIEADHWYWMDEGPDYRAVLVPSDVNDDLRIMAPYLAITVITVAAAPEKYGYPHRQFRPDLPSGERHPLDHKDWHELLFGKRHRLPEYVPTVAAGASAPLQLTTWKIGAIRLCVLLGATGFLTRADFKVQHVDIRRWIAEGWIIAGDAGFVAGKYLPDFKSKQPGDWDQIAADTAKWQRVTAPQPLMVIPERPPVAETLL